MAKARKVRTGTPVKRSPRKFKLPLNDEVVKKECIQLVYTLYAGQSISLDKLITEAEVLYLYIKGGASNSTARILEMRLPEPEQVPQTPGAQTAPDLSQVHTQSNHRSKFEETHTL